MVATSMGEDLVHTLDCILCQLVGQLAWQAHLSQVRCLMPYPTLPRSKWTTPVLGLANPNLSWCAATLMNKHISYVAHPCT